MNESNLADLLDEAVEHNYFDGVNKFEDEDEAGYEIKDEENTYCRGISPNQL